MRLIPLKTVVLACLALASAAGHAQFYEVEMTVFTNSSHYAREQGWPDNISVAYPAELTGISTRPVDELYPELTRPNNPPAHPGLLPQLDERFSRHGEHIAKLQQSGRHRLLFSKTWLQKIEGPDNARNVLIQGGRLEANVHELGGTIRLHTTPAPDNKPDTLHITTRLWLVGFGVADGTRWPIPVSYAIGQEGPTALPTDPNAPIQRVAVLNTSEVITPGTLHYIDHPLFGVLVEIRPYSAITLTE